MDANKLRVVDGVSMLLTDEQAERFDKLAEIRMSTENLMRGGLVENFDHYLDAVSGGTDVTLQNERLAEVVSILVMAMELKMVDLIKEFKSRAVGVFSLATSNNHFHESAWRVLVVMCEVLENPLLTGLKGMVDEITADATPVAAENFDPQDGDGL